MRIFESLHTAIEILYRFDVLFMGFYDILHARFHQLAGRLQAFVELVHPVICPSHALVSLGHAHFGLGMHIQDELYSSFDIHTVSSITPAHEPSQLHTRASDNTTSPARSAL